MGKGRNTGHETALYFDKLTLQQVCAEPGDLLLWDSRTAHYNLSSTTDQPRFCVYTCYMPVADATQEDLRRKKDAFESESGLSDNFH